MHALTLMPILTARGVAPPLTWPGVLTQWHLELGVLVPLLTGAGLYIGGVARLRRRGDAWSTRRVVWWLLGLVIVAVAVSSALGVYDDVLFSVPAIQHMLLQMIAPALLALAAPITLALRVLSATPRRLLLAVTHSRPVRVVGHPGVAFAIFAVTQFVLYYTPLFEATLRHGWLHNLAHLHLVAVGFLFYWSLLAIDPVPHRPSWPMKFLLVLGMAPMHILLGIPIMMSDRLFAGDYYLELGRTWGPSLVSDQHIGGAIMWAFGDVSAVLLIIAFLAQWSRSDEREARRLDRQLDRIHGDAATTTPWWRQPAPASDRHRPEGSPPNPPQAGWDSPRTERSR